MKILLNCLTYGNRPLDIIKDNLSKAGYYPYYVNYISKEGIANAMNEGLLDYEEYDAIGYLSNDIIEPERWLAKKIDALIAYPEAGIVASSLDYLRTTIHNELIISNYLIKKELIDKIGGFNEQMFPYGPIDLDYCERAWVAGYKTYYVMNLMASHLGGHATGDEYGWNKTELVAKYMPDHERNIIAYRNYERNIKIDIK
jgi:GT2 family glycosyltransferase